MISFTLQVIEDHWRLAQADDLRAQASAFQEFDLNYAPFLDWDGPRTVDGVLQLLHSAP